MSGVLAWFDWLLSLVSFPFCVLSVSYGVYRIRIGKRSGLVLLILGVGAFGLCLNVVKGVLYDELAVKVLDATTTSESMSSRPLGDASAAERYFEQTGRIRSYGGSEETSVAFAPTQKNVDRLLERERQIWGMERARSDMQGLLAGSLVSLLVAIAFGWICGSSYERSSAPS